MVEPDFTEVADPRTGLAAMLVSGGASGDAGKVKTRVRQAGLTTETLSPKADNPGTARQGRCKVTEFLISFLCAKRLSLRGSILKFGVNHVLIDSPSLCIVIIITRSF